MSARGARFEYVDPSWVDAVAFRRGGDATIAGGLFGTGFGADAVAEIKATDRDVTALDDQLIAQIPPLLRPQVLLVRQGGLPSPEALHDPHFAFWDQSWLPWVHKWNAYRDDKLSLRSQAIDFAKGPLLLRNDYFDAQSWKDELRAMWNAAAAHGFHLGDVAPPAGEKSIGEHAQGALSTVVDAGKSALSTGGTMIKVLLWGGIGLVGAAGVVLVVNEARGKTRRFR